MLKLNTHTCLRSVWFGRPSTKQLKTQEAPNKPNLDTHDVRALLTPEWWLRTVNVTPALRQRKLRISQDALEHTFTNTSPLSAWCQLTFDLNWQSYVWSLTDSSAVLVTQTQVQDALSGRVIRTPAR